MARKVASDIIYQNQFKQHKNQQQKMNKSLNFLQWHFWAELNINGAVKQDNIIKRTIRIRAKGKVLSGT